MLPITILFFLPNIMTANLQNTYMEQFRSTPSRYTGNLPFYYRYPTPYPKLPVAIPDRPFSETYQIHWPKKGESYKLYQIDKELKKNNATKIKLPYFMDLAYVANQADFNDNTKKEYHFVDDPKLSSSSDESIQEVDQDLPSNDESKPSYTDEDYEDILLNKNNLSKLSNPSIPVPASTTNNEEVTDNIPKLYDENSPLPLSTENPEHVNQETFLLNTSPTPFYYKIPLLTEQSIYNPINDAFLPSNKEKTYNSQLPVLTEIPENKKVFHHISQFPIVTENPAQDDFFSYDNPSDYKSELPVFSDKTVKEWDNTRKDRLIKVKLVSLILSTKKDLDRQIENIRPIHNTFKSGTMYKIGYLISLINKMTRRLSKLYASVQSNIHSWDAIRMLDTYEKIKSDTDLVADMVKLMRAFLRAKRKSTIKQKGAKELAGERHRQNDMAISWSYYDDSLS